MAQGAPFASMDGSPRTSAAIQMEPDDVGFPFGDLPVMGAAVVTVADLRLLVEHMNSKLLVQASAIRALQEEAFRAKDTEALSVVSLQELKAATAQVSHQVAYLKEERLEPLERELLVSSEEAARQKQALGSLEAALEDFRNEVRGPLVQEVLSGLNGEIEALRIDLRKAEKVSSQWDQKLQATNGELGVLAEELRSTKVMNSVETEALRGLVSNLEVKESALRERTGGIDATLAVHERSLEKLKQDVQDSCSRSDSLQGELKVATQDLRSFVSDSESRQQAAESETTRAHARLDKHEGELGKAQEILASLRLFVDNDLRRHLAFAGQRFEDTARELQKLQVRLEGVLEELPEVRQELTQFRLDQERDKEDVGYLLSHKRDFERVPEMREDVDEALARTSELRARAQDQGEVMERLERHQTEIQRHFRYDHAGNLSLRCGNATLTLSTPETAGNPEDTMSQQLQDSREKVADLEKERQGLLEKVGMLREKALHM